MVTWYTGTPALDGWATCSRCGIRTALVGQDGECLRCLLERWREARATGGGVGRHGEPSRKVWILRSEASAREL